MDCHNKMIKCVVPAFAVLDCPSSHRCPKKKMSKNGGLYCEVCDVRGGSQVSFKQHLSSRKHRQRVATQAPASFTRTENHTVKRKGRGQYFCPLCKFNAPTKAELISHRRSEDHRDRLLDRRAEATLRELGPLFERAQLLLLHADPPIDLKAPNVKIGSLSSKLKDLGLGFACISCLTEGASAGHVRNHLLKKRNHIYPLESIDEEEERVFQKIEARSAGVEDDLEKAMLVFIVKKALLIKVFLDRNKGV